MMRWMVKSSMHFRLLVVVAAGVILFFGFTQLRDMPVDLLPEFSRPYVEIQTEALGLSASEVEALITTPLEADMLNGCPWVDEIRSESIPGLSSIVLIFKPGTDLLDARQVAQERLTEVFALPNVSKPPTMLNPLSSTSRIMKVGLSSEVLSLVEMSVLARWTIKPRLMGIPGVANVSIWGQRKRQLQVLVDPAKLREEDVTLHQVISTAGNALWYSPLSFLNASTPGTGGWIETPNQRLGVRHLLPISTPEQLAQVSVEGTEMRLGDVARVVETHQPLIGDAIVNDEPSLMLVIEKFPWVNTVEVTRSVEEALGSLSLGLSGLTMESGLYRPATFIGVAMANLSKSLLVGGGLVVLALFAFLFNWRTALISIVAILVSLLATVLVLQLTGTAVNMLVIVGIAIALVVIIDDAIADLDNIARRLRQHRQEGGDQSIPTVIVEASLEMRSALGYATVMLVLAVAPLFLMDGVYGAFFQAIVYPYVLAITISMIVALAVTTVLSLLLLSHESAQRGESPLARRLHSVYDAVCLRIVRSPQPVFAFICIVLVGGLFLLPRLKRDSFLPTFKETDLSVHLDSTAGTSHPAMVRIVSQLSRDLRSIPGVRDVSAHLGRAVMSDEVDNINSSEMWVSIDPGANYDGTKAAIQEVVESYPGLEREVMTYTEECVSDALSDEPHAVTVRVYGDDFKVMRRKAEEVAAVLAKVDGVLAPEVDSPVEEPSLEIEVDLEKAKQYGLKPGDVRRSAAALLSGIEVGNLFEEQKVFDVVVWGEPETRHSLTSIRKLVIDTPIGGHTTLSEVADIRFAPAATVIERESVARHVDVTAQVIGNDYATIAADIERGIEKIDFPLEYRAELLPGYGKRLAHNDRLIGIAVAAAIGIFLLLQAAFGSWRLATAVFLTLPVALVGGALAAYASGNIISLGSLAGFLAVFAIAVRNAVTMVKHYQHLEQHEGRTFGPELVLRGTGERSVPIVMSAIVIALAFLPLVLYGDLAGQEIAYPLAVVVLGGLITSTLLSLLGVPAVYLLFGKSPEPGLVAESQMNSKSPAVLGGPALDPTT